MTSLAPIPEPTVVEFEATPIGSLGNDADAREEPPQLSSTPPPSYARMRPEGGIRSSAASARRSATFTSLDVATNEDLLRLFPRMAAKRAAAAAAAANNNKDEHNDDGDDGRDNDGDDGRDGGGADGDGGGGRAIEGRRPIAVCRIASGLHRGAAASSSSSRGDGAVFFLAVACKTRISVAFWRVAHSSVSMRARAAPPLPSVRSFAASRFFLAA